MASFVAAQAASHAHRSAEAILFGPNRRPSAAGARWYEREIPGVDVLSRTVKTQSDGDPGEYIKKVGGPVSAYFRVRNNFLAFNYNDAHEFLWEKFQGRILETDVDYHMVSTAHWGDYDFVINTMPRPTFYPREDHAMFAATRHWRSDELNDGTTNPFTLPGNQDKNLMIFDGLKESSWFRISQMFGLMSVEWGFHKRPPIENVFLEILPLGVPAEVGLNTIIPEWRGTTALAHVGALAQWEPSTDVGEVYQQTLDILNYNWEEYVRYDDDRRGRDSVAKPEAPQNIFKEEEKDNG